MRELKDDGRSLTAYVYDLNLMVLDVAKPEDFETAVYLKRDVDKLIQNIDSSYELQFKRIKSACERVIADKDKKIAELESENRFVKERLEQQEKIFKWHKVEMLFGNLTGDLPSKDLNRICGRDFLVHYTVIYGGVISHGIAYSDYDEDEGFFELEDNYTPVHWCEVPLPPLEDKFKEA